MIELAALREPRLLATTVAQCLGLSAGRDPDTALLDTLRHKRAVLILDNCEHLLIAVARLAETLLQAAPGLHILATSRESLGILSATAWRVPSLSLPRQPTNATPAELLTSEALQLFVERARAAQSSFSLTALNAVAVAEICRRLDGVPLALELAAMRVFALSPQQIAERLADRFALLTDGNRTTLPRHQTLRALIDRSYDLLSIPEQHLLQRGTSAPWLQNHLLSPISRRVKHATRCWKPSRRMHASVWCSGTQPTMYSSSMWRGVASSRGAPTTPTPTDSSGRGTAGWPPIRTTCVWHSRGPCVKIHRRQLSSSQTFGISGFGAATGARALPGRHRRSRPQRIRMSSARPP
jgi:hypothetical protein